MMKTLARCAAIVALAGLTAALSLGCGHWYPGYSFQNEDPNFTRSTATRGMPTQLKNGDFSAEDDWSELFPGAEDSK